MPIRDFVQLRDYFRDEARDAFHALRRSHPGERVYAFGLHTDDDVVATSPVGNTEEALARKLAEYPASNCLERWAVQYAFRWSPDEWPSIYTADNPHPASRSLGPADMPSEMMTFKASWTALPGNDFQGFRARTFRAMLEALRILDSEGLFGRGKEREGITLLMAITDSADSGLLELESIKLLNPRRVARQMAKSCPIPLRWLVWLEVVRYWARRVRRGPIISNEPLLGRDN